MVVGLRFPCTTPAECTNLIALSKLNAKETTWSSSRLCFADASSNVLFKLLQKNSVTMKTWEEVMITSRSLVVYMLFSNRENYLSIWISLMILWMEFWLLWLRGMRLIVQDSLVNLLEALTTYTCSSFSSISFILYASFTAFQCLSSLIVICLFWF